MSQKFDSNYFEYIFCYNALNNAEYLTSVVDYYNPEHFQNSDIKVVMNIVVDFFQKRSVIPNVTEIKTYLTTEESKNAFIRVLQYFKTLDRNYNIDELYENTEQFLRERAVYNALLKTTTNLSNSSQVDTTQILDTFNSACTISLVDNLGLDYFEEVNKLCDEIVKPNNTISTGWKWLDDRIGGGYQADGKALYVFSGFTNVGKSIFLGNATINLLKQNKTIVLVTLEMPETIYAKRISSNISQVPLLGLSQSIDEVKQSIISFKGAYNSKLIIKEFPTKGMTINHLNSYLQKLIKKGIKPDVFIVDYLNLMKTTRRHGSTGMYEEVKEIAEQLRASTYLFNIPCITATQLNRKGAGLADPGMETTSESIGLSFTVDGQFSIWSDENDKELGMIHLGIMKNRYGPNTGATALKIDYNTLTLTEIPQVVTSISSQEISSATNALADIQKKLG